MKWKRTKLYSILTLTCPHCHEGQFLAAHPYDLSRAGDLPERCAVCGRSNHGEPGFYFGAMYVSYGLAVGMGLVMFLLLRVAAPQLALYWIIGIIGASILLAGPYLYAVSKSIWANLFTTYTGSDGA